MNKIIYSLVAVIYTISLILFLYPESVKADTASLYAVGYTYPAMQSHHDVVEEPENCRPLVTIIACGTGRVLEWCQTPDSKNHLIRDGIMPLRERQQECN